MRYGVLAGTDKYTDDIFDTSINLRPPYVIVTDSEAQHLRFIDRITELMSCGYDLAGGVSTRPGSSSGAYLLQAMVYKGD